MRFDWINTLPARVVAAWDRLHDALTNVSWFTLGSMLARAQRFTERLRPILIIGLVGLAFLLGVDTGIDYQKAVLSQRAASVETAAPVNIGTVKPPRQQACPTRRCS